jgi:hypothetical protein
MKLLQRSIALACLFGVASPTASAQRGGGVFRQGQPLPDLELPTIDGKRTINLADLGGKKVLLIQFASW